MDQKRIMMNKSIVKLLNIAKKENIIRGIQQDIYYFHDEPRIPSFNIELKYRSFSTPGFEMERLRRYSAFSAERCLLKALGEAIERYSLSIYRREEFLWDNYKHLNKKAIDPRRFASFSELRIKPWFKIYNNYGENLNWTKAKCLNSQQDILVPAQLVYLPYRFKKNESVIYFSISTGTALFTSLNKAILTGLLETIERDAFMINYLNKLSRNIIDIRRIRDQIFKRIISLTERYNLNLYILDISTDVPVYSILAILIDETGLGPAVSIGAKADLNIKDAIVGATEECFQVRPWIKGEMVRQGIKAIKKAKSDKYHVSRIVNRGLLWSTPDMINKIDFFLKGKKLSINDIRPRRAKDLYSPLGWFRKKKIDVIYVDVTPANLQNKVFAVKVMVLEFQPLYLDERYPSWVRKRLEEVPVRVGFKPLKKINRFPHPFL